MMLIGLALALCLGAFLGSFSCWLIMRDPPNYQLGGRHRAQPEYSPAGRGFWDDA